MAFQYIHTPIHNLDYQIILGSDPPLQRGIHATRSLTRTGDWSLLILSDEDIFCGTLYEDCRCRLDTIVAEATYYQHLSLCREVVKASNCRIIPWLRECVVNYNIAAHLL